MWKQRSLPFGVVAAVSLLFVLFALAFAQSGRAVAATDAMSEQRQSGDGMGAMGNMRAMTGTMPAAQTDMGQMMSTMGQMMQQMQQIHNMMGAGPMGGSMPITGPMSRDGTGRGAMMQMMGMMMQVMGHMQTMVDSAPCAAAASGQIGRPAVAPPAATLQGSVWVADEYGNSITVIDAATNRVAATLTGVLAAGGIAFMLLPFLDGVMRKEAKRSCAQDVRRQEAM